MSKNKLVIGFMGLARAGKSESAKQLTNLFPLVREFERCSFATPLKNACAGLFLFTPQQMYGNLKEEVDERWGFSPREAMQKLGTDCVRDLLCSNFWVRRMRQVIDGLPDKSIVIIDDCRFADEVMLLSEYAEGSGCWLVERSSADGPIEGLLKRIKSFVDPNPPNKTSPTHASENPPIHLAKGLIYNRGIKVSELKEEIEATELASIVREYVWKCPSRVSK